jgi:hypothetical protein
VRLSRSKAIALSGFPRRTARMARTYSVQVRNHGPASRSTDVASSRSRSARSASPVTRVTDAIALNAVPVPDGIASERNLSMLRANQSRATLTLPAACST